MGVRLCLGERFYQADGELAMLLYALTGWVAVMERRHRSEKTKAVLARVVAMGRKLGQPKGSRDKKKRKRRKAL